MMMAGWGCRDVIEEVKNLANNKHIPYAATNKVVNLFPNHTEMTKHPEFLGLSGDTVAHQ